MGIHHTTPWIDFLAMMGSGVITFLAGAIFSTQTLYHACLGTIKED